MFKKKPISVHRHGSVVVWHYTIKNPEGFAGGTAGRPLDVLRADPSKIVLGHYSMQKHSMANVLGVKQMWVTHGAPHLPAWILPGDLS